MNQLVENIAAQCQCEMRQEPYGKPEKIRTTSARIVVSGSKEKPYYEIEYFDFGDKKFHLGFGSCCLDYVFDWLDECFEVVVPEREAGKCS